MKIRSEISICYCSGNTEIIRKNINIIFENKEYQINNATVEKMQKMWRCIYSR